MRFLPFVLVAWLIAMSAFTIFTAYPDNKKTVVTKSLLAQRIEAACTKPGYSATDWTVGDEWNPIPEGLVKVTCTHKTNYSTYNTVVSR